MDETDSKDNDVGVDDRGRKVSSCEIFLLMYEHPREKIE
jgi:hypothetical protein